MPVEWTRIPLGEITTWSSGGTPPKDDARYWGGSIPWISASSMTGTRFSDSALKLTESGLKRGSRLAETGTVLLLVRGSMLHQRVPVGIATRSVAFNQDVKAIRAKTRLDPWFLLYWFISNEQRLLNMVDFTGIGAGRFDTKQLQGMTIDLPPLHEQKAIVRVAKVIDDRIHLGVSINLTLDQIASRIFQAWFVDFLPVRAKVAARVEGRDPLRAAMCALSGKDEAALDAMPREQYEQLAATAALFPDEMADSELGEVPRGWEATPLDGIAEYLNGLALQRFPPENERDRIPVIKIAQLKKGDTAGADWASAKIKPSYIVEDGDVLFSWSGSLEVDVWCGGRGALNQHLFKVTSMHYPKWFFYYWTKHHLAGFQRIAAGKAVTMGHIQRRHLTEALCLVPPRSLLEAMDGFIAPLLAAQIQRRKESRTLAELRDTLLPKLLSGEIRVGEAQELAEAVA